MRRLALVIHSLNGGGAERNAAEMANWWSSHGTQVTLITLDCASTDLYHIQSNVERIDWLTPRGALRLNPLIGQSGLCYPSEGWRREYEDDCQDLQTYHLRHFITEDTQVNQLLRGDRTIDQLSTTDRRDLYRKRVLVDLPAAW